MAYLYFIYCQVKERIHEETKSYKYDQDVHVYGMSGHEPSLSIIFHGYGLYIYFLTCLVSMWYTFFGHASILFLTFLLGMWHTFFGYASFHHFLAHTIDDNTERAIMKQYWSFYGWMEGG